MNDAKQKVCERIDQLADRLVRLSHDIHSHPEVSLSEHKSAAFIAEMLREQGFAVTVGAGGLDTAVVAHKEGRTKRPHIALFAEYD